MHSKGSQPSVGQTTSLLNVCPLGLATFFGKKWHPNNWIAPGKCYLPCTLESLPNRCSIQEANGFKEVRQIKNKGCIWSTVIVQIWNSAFHCKRRDQVEPSIIFLLYNQATQSRQSAAYTFLVGKGVGSDTVAVAGSILNSVFAHDLFSSQNFTFWSLITFFFFCRPKIFL